MKRKINKTPDGRRIPGYSHHKPSGRAYVRINGEFIPLGAYDPSEGSPSMEQYRRLIAEWRVNGYRTPGVSTQTGGPQSAMTVRELTAWFLTWAESNYSRSEFLLCRQALKELCGLYGGESVTAVGVTELRAVRQGLLDRGQGDRKTETPLARKTINGLIGRIQRAFALAASEGLIPANAAAAARALKPLKKGRTEALDYKPRGPADWKDVERVLPRLSPQVAAIIETLWHTGARIGEICQLRSCDVDMSAEVWIFDPEQHKTDHHDLGRSIVIGPRAQQILRPFAKLDPTRYWFNAIDESLNQQRVWNEASPAERKRRKLRGARPGAVSRDDLDPRVIERRLGEACEAAGVKFTSHQLRHAALTRIRDEHGIESARLIAGQHSDVVTRGYTHSIETRKAAEIAKMMG